MRSNLYTLVRHSGWSIGCNPSFRQAVELKEISSTVAAKILAKQGLVFNSWTDANTAEEIYNYPDPNYVGVIPKVEGDFISIPGYALEVFIPARKPSVVFVG